LETLYEYSDYSDVESMIIHVDFFLNKLSKRRAYQNLWKHLETGYHDDFYVPLIRYQELLIEYSTIDGGVPFHFNSETPKNIQEEVNSLQYILGQKLGTLIEDIFENDLYLKGECSKCP